MLYYDKVFKNPYEMIGTLELVKNGWKTGFSSNQIRVQISNVSIENVPETGECSFRCVPLFCQSTALNCNVKNNHQ